MIALAICLCLCLSVSAADLPAPQKPTAAQLKGAAVANLWQWSQDAQARDAARLARIEELEAALLARPAIDLSGIGRIETRLSMLAPIATQTQTRAIYALGTRLTVAVDLVPDGPALARIEYFDDRGMIGTATAAPWTISWTPTVAGRYVLAARVFPLEGAAENAPTALVEVITP